MSVQRDIYTGDETGGKPKGFPLLASNGKIPSKYLRRLETQPQMPDNEEYLWPAAAIGLDAMVRAAALDDVSIWLLEAYRTYARQVYFWNLYQSGKGNLAAKPGTSSHGFGTAIDVDRSHDSQAIPWMQKHAAPFGWGWPAWAAKLKPNGQPTEVWHWQFRFGFEYKPIGVFVHGKPLPGLTPFRNTDNAIWVPLRAIVDALGGSIESFPPGQAKVRLGTRSGLLAFEIHGGKGFSPARAFEEKLGIPVSWTGGAVRVG